MASNRDERFIRQIVRDEISTRSSPETRNNTPPVQNGPVSSPLESVAASVLDRTRGLVEQLQHRNNNNRNARNDPPIRRRVPKRKFNQSKEDIPKRESKWVYVLEAWDENQGTKLLDDCSFKDKLVVCKAQIEFLSSFCEDQVRNEIASVIKNRIPNIGSSDFHFVKRDRFTLSVPVVKEGHKWNFENVKQLCGQGIVYVRLNRSKKSFATELNVNENEISDGEILEDGDINDDVIISHVVSSDFQSTSDGNGGGHPSHPSVSTIPSLFFQRKVSQLQEMFPGKPRQTLLHALNVTTSVEEAVGYLTGRAERESEDFDRSSLEMFGLSSGTVDELRSLKSVLQYLWKNHSEEKVKLRIDPEDILQDAFAFYKSSGFDESCPLRIVYNGQPAADSGGVLRQFYSDVFNKVVENYFHGDNNKKLPIPSSDILMSGMMVILGKMIVHSLLQGGPGFPFFPLACYKYLATGDTANAAIDVDASDVASPLVKLYIQQVCLLKLGVPGNFLGRGLQW